MRITDTLKQKGATALKCATSHLAVVVWHSILLLLEQKPKQNEMKLRWALTAEVGVECGYKSPEH